MKFSMSPASLNALEASRPPAIIRPAEIKNCAFYEAKLRECEGEYDRWLDEFKTSGAWKEKYTSWEACCELHFDVSRRAIDKRIQKYKTGTKVPGQPDTHDNKELAALKKVEDARLPDPPKEDDEERPHIKTAPESIADTAAKNGEAVMPESRPPMDLSGCIIPQHLLALRERRQEVSDAAHWASKLKSLFERNQNETDPLFSHLKQSGNIQTFMTGAASMRFMLAECSPDVVCPQCSGKSTDCKQCWGSGWISEVRWNRDFVKSHDRLIQAEVKRRAANL